MKRSIRNISLLLFLMLSLLTFSSSLTGQPAGMPIFSNSHREVTLSINGGYVQKNINGVTYTSPRYLLKGILGLEHFVDLFAEVGFAKVFVDPPKSDQPNLEGKYQMALGGGLSIRLLNLPRYRFSLFINGQIFRFTNSPSSETTRPVANTELTEVLELKYDWREASLNAGVTKGLGAVNAYVGLNAKLIQRLETKIFKIIIEGGGESVSKQTGEYLSGVKIGPFFGLDFSLPSRLKLSLELTGRKRSDFAFYLGISQTGKP